MSKSSTHLSWHSHNSKFAGVGVQSFMSGEICLARTPCYLEMISVFGWDNLTENLWDFGNNNDGSRIKWGVLETTSQHFEILLTYKLLFIHPPALLNPSKLPAKWHWVCEDIKKRRKKIKETTILQSPPLFKGFIQNGAAPCSGPSHFCFRGDIIADEKYRHSKSA